VRDRVSDSKNGRKGRRVRDRTALHAAGEKETKQRNEQVHRIGM
jgi:hypothetical protein